MNAEPCPSCGARVGGRSGCQAAFDELLPRAWEDPARASVHNLVVDAYAMQHVEEYGRSAKSYVMHLTGLCCALEAAGDPRLYWAIPRWLDGPARVARPENLDSRGRLTVLDVLHPEHDETYPDLVRRWAREVWGAYSPQQALARAWLDSVRRTLRV
jgi:hypothetical protein